MIGLDDAIGEVSRRSIEDSEEWEVKVAVVSLPAFGGDRSSPWVDYDQTAPTQLRCHLVFSFTAELDEDYESEEEAYEDGAREYSLLAYFEAARAGMSDHPYADDQFLASVHAALSEVGLAPGPQDVEPSEQGAQSAAFAHFEVSFEFAARVRARFE